MSVGTPAPPGVPPFVLTLRQFDGLVRRDGPVRGARLTSPAVWRDGPARGPVLSALPYGATVVHRVPARLPVGGLDDGVALTGQEIGHQRADPGIVLHHQDRLRSGPIRLCRRTHAPCTPLVNGRRGCSFR